MQKENLGFTKLQFLKFDGYKYLFYSVSDDFKILNMKSCVKAGFFRRKHFVLLPKKQNITLLVISISNK